MEMDAEISETVISKPGRINQNYLPELKLKEVTLHTHTAVVMYTG